MTIAQQKYVLSVEPVFDSFDSQYAALISALKIQRDDTLILEHVLLIQLRVRRGIC
jgi:hypothetical protein